MLLHWKITMKDSDYIKVNSVNPLYLVISKVDGYIEEKIGNKYLTLFSTDKNKEVLIKYTELWDKVKNLIKKINHKPDEYDEKYMKIKFNSDDNLSLNKILKIHNMAIAVRSVFQEDGNVILKFFEMNVYMNYKC